MTSGLGEDQRGAPSSCRSEEALGVMLREGPVVRNSVDRYISRGFLSMGPENPMQPLSSPEDGRSGCGRSRSVISSVAFRGISLVFLSACFHQEGPPPDAQAIPANVIEYQGVIVIDPVTRTLRAEWLISLAAEDALIGELAFLLNRGATIQRVEGPAVRSHQTEFIDGGPGGMRLLVELEDGKMAESPSALTVSYFVKLDATSDGMNRISSDWVELSVESAWHPLLATLDREIVGVVEVALPPEWSVVSSGSVSQEGGFHVIRTNVPQIDLAFIASPTLHRVESERAVLYHEGVAEEHVHAILEATGDCLGYLNEQFSARPFTERPRVVLAPREGPGYGRKDFIVLSHVDPEEPIVLTRFLCHELAHYWTDFTGARSPDHWMTEAFAEYVSLRYVRQRFGQAAFDSILAHFEEIARSQDPVWTPESTDRTTGLAMYRKAPLILSWLEERMGREAFERFLRTYMVETIRTTVELLGALRLVAGDEVVEEFRGRLGSIE
jgi:hypothetical protein